MKEIKIKTQKELDALTRVEKDESVEIVGEGLKLNANIEVFGFLKISVKVEMSWSTFYVEARESSRVVARESSRVEARESSSVVARESSSVVAWGSSRVVARGSSVSWVYDLKVKIKLFGWSVSYKMFAGKGNITKERDTATIIEVPEQQETFEDYSDRYGVLAERNIVKMYKAVHKDEKGFFSDYDKSFRYEIGKEYKEKCAAASSGACARGLHVAFKSWACMFGISWQDFALIECEIEVKDIVVSKDTDGKVRCSKLKVLREVPESDYYN